MATSIAIPHSFNCFFSCLFLMLCFSPSHHFYRSPFQAAAATSSAVGSWLTGRLTHEVQIQSDTAAVSSRSRGWSELKRTEIGRACAGTRWFLTAKFADQRGGAAVWLWGHLDWVHGPMGLGSSVSIIRTGRVKHWYTRLGGSSADAEREGKARV